MSTKYELARSVDGRLLRSHAETLWLPSLLTIGALYTGIWLTAWMTSIYGAIAWIPAVLIIAAFQNHFSILMHEAAHRLLLPSKIWNDRIGHALFAAPILMLLKDYRYIHLKHHKHSGDPEHDPEIAFYHGAEIGYGVKERRLKQNLINDFSGMSTLRSMSYLSRFLKQRTEAGEIRKTDAQDILWSIGGWITLLAPAFALGFGGTLLVLWAVAYLTITPLLIRWHGVGEHTGENADVEQEKTLTHDFPFIVDFFLYPLRSGWHLEHHLFPQIPWYQMRKLRRELMKDPHYVAEAAKLTVDGFWWGQRTVRQIVLER